MTKIISHVTIFKLCDWSNSSIDTNFTLEIFYEIGSWQLLLMGLIRTKAEVRIPSNEAVSDVEGTAYPG